MSSNEEMIYGIVNCLMKEKAEKQVEIYQVDWGSCRQNITGNDLKTIFVSTDAVRSRRILILEAELVKQPRELRLK